MVAVGGIMFFMYCSAKFGGLLFTCVACLESFLQLAACLQVASKQKNLKRKRLKIEIDRLSVNIEGIITVVIRSPRGGNRNDGVQDS